MKFSTIIYMMAIVAFVHKRIGTALYQLGDLRRRREQELYMEQKRGESLMARKDALQKKREAYRGKF